MPINKSKRPRYDPITYGRLTGGLTRLIENTPHLLPNRETWDIEGDWAKAGAIHFIDVIHQPAFVEYEDFDCRVIKLVNLNKPAVRLTFYPVHRYWVLKDKDLPPDEQERRIVDYANMLTVKIEIQERKLLRLVGAVYSKAKGDIALMENERAKWTNILRQLDRYELCVSNYERNHIYTNVNWKYALETGEYGNEQMHLLSNQRDNDGQITQARHNVIFVDPIEVLRYHPYQNKQIDTFLERFEQRAALGRDKLYARLRPEQDDIAKFEAVQVTSKPTRKKTKPVGLPADNTLNLFDGEA